MKQFIIDLYANDNFPIYLSCVIVVLLIAFFIVFFLGKKDKKKIEETQRLERINADAFKEVSSKDVVEVPVQDVPIMQETQSEINELKDPNISELREMPVPQETPTLVTDTKIEDTVAYFDTPSAVDEEVLPTPVQPIPPVIEETIQPANMLLSNENVVSEVAQETLSPIETLAEPENRPEVQNNFDEVPNFDELAASIAKELDALEEEQKKAAPYLNKLATPTEAQPSLAPLPENLETIVEEPKAVPDYVIPEASVSPAIEEQKPILEEIQEEPIIKPLEPSKPNQTKIVSGVFSSVYAPPKKEVNIFDDTMAIELPKLKEQPNDEIHKSL